MQNCRYHHQGSYVFAGVHRSACWAAGLRKTEWISMILGYRMGLDQEKTQISVCIWIKGRIQEKAIKYHKSISYNSLESGSKDIPLSEVAPRKSSKKNAALLFLNLSRGERLLSYFPFFLVHNFSFPSISVSDHCCVDFNMLVLLLDSLVCLGINTCNEAKWDRGSFICSGCHWPKQCFTPSGGASVSRDKDP